MDLDPAFVTDRLFSGMMDFAGKVSTFTCSTQLAEYQRVNILGTTGRIEILIPFNAPPDKPCTIILQDDSSDTVEKISFDACDQYTIQADRFAMAVINGTDVPTPLTDALNNMHVLETLVKSAETGQWAAC
jgi:predicted dehydrogenase